MYYGELTTDRSLTNGSPLLVFTKDGTKYYIREKFSSFPASNMKKYPCKILPDSMTKFGFEINGFANRVAPKAQHRDVNLDNWITEQKKITTPNWSSSSSAVGMKEQYYTWITIYYEFYSQTGEVVAQLGLRVSTFIYQHMGDGGTSSFLDLIYFRRVKPSTLQSGDPNASYSFVVEEQRPADLSLTSPNAVNTLYSKDLRRFLRLNSVESLTTVKSIRFVSMEYDFIDTIIEQYRMIMGRDLSRKLFCLFPNRLIAFGLYYGFDVCVIDPSRKEGDRYMLYHFGQFRPGMNSDHTTTDAFTTSSPCLMCSYLGTVNHLQSDTMTWDQDMLPASKIKRMNYQNMSGYDTVRYLMELSMSTTAPLPPPKNSVFYFGANQSFECKDFKITSGNAANEISSIFGGLSCLKQGIEAGIVMYNATDKSKSLIIYYHLSFIGENMVEQVNYTLKIIYNLSNPRLFCEWEVIDDSIKSTFHPAVPNFSGQVSTILNNFKRIRFKCVEYDFE